MFAAIRSSVSSVPVRGAAVPGGVGRRGAVLRGGAAAAVGPAADGAGAGCSRRRVSGSAMTASASRSANSAGTSTPGNTEPVSARSTAVPATRSGAAARLPREDRSAWTALRLALGPDAGGAALPCGVAGDGVLADASACGLPDVGPAQPVGALR